MISRPTRLALLLASVLMPSVLMTAPPCFAAGQAALLQSGLTLPEKIWVGQRLDLNVTLFTTTSFTGVPRFDLPKDGGLVIIADDSSPLLGTKTIDGVSYMSKQYAITLFPLRPGALTVPSFPVEFGYTGDAGQELGATLSTTAANITVLAVPGADGKLPLVTATDFTITDRWDPSPDKAAVGDAFTRTITMRADGVPGMAIPALRMESLAGLAVYAKQPQVSTDTARGDFIGKRVETFSLVCQDAGRIALPEMRVQWWNPAAQVLRDVTLRPVVLQVAPNPAMAPGGSGSADGASGARSAWLWATAAGLFAVAAAGLMVLLRRKHAHPALAGAQRERHMFQHFKRVAATQGETETMQALIQWFDVASRQHDITVLSFIRQFGYSDLEKQFSALETCLYGKQKERWSGDVLARGFAEARRKYLHNNAHHPRLEALGPLNP